MVFISFCQKESLPSIIGKERIKIMKDIKIVVDTSADMPKEFLEKYDIGLINFLTVFNEKSYVAGVDIDNDDFYRMLAESDKLPTTAQTPYQDMYDYLLAESKNHKTVIYFVISSKGSGQSNTARMVVEEIKEGDNPNADIRIIDTLSYSVYIASTAVHAAELVKAGADADEILKSCAEYIKSWEVYLLVDSLKYLEKGGRITKTAAIVGSLLDIKPVLTIRDGLIEPVEKLRGKKKLAKKLIELIKENPEYDSEKKEFMVIHSDKQKGDEMVEALKDEFGDITLTMFSKFGPIIGTHTGPGCLAVLFRLKNQ